METKSSWLTAPSLASLLTKLASAFPGLWTYTSRRDTTVRPFDQLTEYPKVDSISRSANAAF